MRLINTSFEVTEYVNAIQILLQSPNMIKVEQLNCSGESDRHLLMIIICFTSSIHLLLKLAQRRYSILIVMPNQV